MRAFRLGLVLDIFMRDLTHPAERLVAAMDRIYRYRMTTTSGGNLSLKDSDGNIWITPARVDKGKLKAEDIVKAVKSKVRGISKFREFYFPNFSILKNMNAKNNTSGEAG